jgi:heat-inducible transcriptional repressor
MVRFVPLNRNSIMVVFISESGILQHRVIPREKGITNDDLYRFAEEVNTRFAGKSLNEVFKGVLKEMENKKAQYDHIYHNLLKMTGDAMELWKSENESELYWEGMSNVLEQREFWEDVERLRALFKAFEEKGRLAKILWRCIERENLQVVIGSEAEIDDLKDVSILAAPCCYNERPLGAIAVLGSRRIDYRKMVALIQETASLVNEILIRREGGFA